MTKINASAAGMNRPSTIAARVDDVADVRAHRALVARQQVGVFAGHHPLAAIGHRRRDARPSRPGVPRGSAWARASPCACAGLGGGHRRGRDRAAAPGRIRASASACPWGRWPPASLTPGPLSATSLGLRRVVGWRSSFLRPSSFTPASIILLRMSGSGRPPRADRPGLLRRQPHRRARPPRPSPTAGGRPGRTTNSPSRRSPTAAPDSSTCWPAGSASVRTLRVAAR